MQVLFCSLLDLHSFNDPYNKHVDFFIFDVLFIVFIQFWVVISFCESHNVFVRFPLRGVCIHNHMLRLSFCYSSFHEQISIIRQVVYLSSAFACWALFSGTSTVDPNHLFLYGVSFYVSVSQRVWLGHGGERQRRNRLHLQSSEGPSVDDWGEACLL